VSTSLLWSQSSYFGYVMGIVKPTPVAARSKAWVCGPSFAGIVGTNPVGAWISVSCVLCCQVEVSASGWSFVQRSATDRGVSKWVWSRSLDNEEALAHWGLLRHGKKKWASASDWFCQNSLFMNTKSGERWYWQARTFNLVEIYFVHLAYFLKHTGMLTLI
jgi:hypothetical protein